MPLNPPRNTCLLALAIAATLPATGSAEPAALQELVITAKGHEADTLDTARAVERLAPQPRDAASNTGDLFRGQPGLAVQGDGGAWGGNPVLRGLRKESVVMMVDGKRLNSAQPKGAIASLAALSLLDSVEVVKGPGSVLHGTGALGGAINLRTPEPAFSARPELSGRLNASAGSVDNHLAGGALVRASSQDHGLVLGAAGKDLDDYDTPDGDVANSGYRSNSWLARYAYRLSDDQTLSVNLQHHADRDVWYPGSRKAGPGGNGSLTIHSPRQERTLLAVDYDAHLGPGTLSASLYRQEVDRQIRAWWDLKARNQVRNDVTFRTDGGQLNYLLPLADHHLVTLGLDSWEMTADPKRFTFKPPMSDSPVANSPFRDGQIRSHGVFLQDDIDLGRWQLQLGARYDRVDGDARVMGNGPGARNEGLDNSANTLSWSTGALYHVSALINPYVHLGTAYRAPDMRERFEDASRGDGYFHKGNPQLDPEKSTTLELGLKGRSLMARYQVAAFYTRIDDYIAGRVTGAHHPQNNLPLKQTENLDEVTIYGAEAGFSLALSALNESAGELAIDGSATWLRGTNEQDDEPLYQMPAPELSVGIGDWQGPGLRWHTQVRAVAEQDRTADRFSNHTELATPGYATLDLRLGWAFTNPGPFTNLELTLSANNLLDKRYREHLTEGNILAPGRGFVLSLGTGFGHQ